MNIKLVGRILRGPHSRDGKRRGTKCWGSTRPADLDENSLLQLLLGSDVGSVTALLLAAVGSPGMKSGVTLAANHLVGVVLLSQQTEGGLDDTTTETQHQVKGRLWKI